MNRHATSLARSLAHAGRDVILRRTNGAAVQVHIDVVVRAFIRDYQPHELAGPLAQGDSAVVIGMTEINAAQWPGGHRATEKDMRLPLKGDRIIYDGRSRVLIGDAVPLHADGEVVRLDFPVRG